MQNFSNGRVLIVGDVMLDRYYHGSTNRISPEAPVPVVRVTNDDCHPGGAGNVALNIAALKGNVSLIGITGKDETHDRLTKRLQNSGVDANFEQLDDVPTITKLRVLCQHQQVIRLDFEQPLHAFDKSHIYKRFDTALDQHDVLILSDYGKGTLSDPQYFIQKARAKNIPVLVDPKGTDFEKYRGATIITPNFSEFTGVVGDCPDLQSILDKGHDLIKKLDLGGLLVTRGSEGMILLQTGQEPISVPTQAREVFDVTGAGDTVIAVFAASIAAGADYLRSVKVANAAAGIVVGKVGSASVSTEELATELSSQSPLPKGIIDEATLQRGIERLQLMGKKVVFTNGCFDILHPGHVAYLQEARAQGDRLIVALNSDESIKKLKGEERPILKLQERMEMVAALDCVDWVIPFEDDTPKRLLSYLKPDVLVKGGDYRREEIVGYEIVDEYGGEVKPLVHREGLSTTNIIEKIRQ